MRFFFASKASTSTTKPNVLPNSRLFKIAGKSALYPYLVNGKSTSDLLKADKLLYCFGRCVTILME